MVWRTEQLHHPSVVPLLKVDLDEVRVVTLGDEHGEDRVAVLAHTASHPECNRAVLFSLPVGGGGSARLKGQICPGGLWLLGHREALRGYAYRPAGPGGSTIILGGP